MVLAMRTQVTFDCADPHAQATFWAQVFGSAVEDHSALVDQLVADGRGFGTNWGPGSSPVCFFTPDPAYSRSVSRSWPFPSQVSGPRPETKPDLDLTRAQRGALHVTTGKAFPTPIAALVEPCVFG